MPEVVFWLWILSETPTEYTKAVQSFVQQHETQENVQALVMSLATMEAICTMNLTHGSTACPHHRRWGATIYLRRPANREECYQLHLIAAEVRSYLFEKTCVNGPLDTFG